MNRILITGATGYIGSNLAMRLREGNEVYVPVRSRFSRTYLTGKEAGLHFVEYDGTYESMERVFRAARPDTVYHLAAFYAGSHDPSNMDNMLDSNVRLGLHVLEAMAQCGAGRLVYTSTSMRYYGNQEYRPLNLYAATKKAFEDILLYYTDTGAVSSVTLTLSDTYGKGDKRPKILNMLKKAAQDNTVMEMSDGTQEYDVVYIDDIVNALVRAGEILEHEKGNLSYRAGCDRILTLKQTVQALERAMGKELPVKWGVRSPSPRQIDRQITVEKLLPGWKPEVSIEEGMKKFLES